MRPSIGVELHVQETDRQERRLLPRFENIWGICERNVEDHVPRLRATIYGILFFVCRRQRRQSTRYAKQLIEDDAWRMEWAGKAGLGFKLPESLIGRLRRLEIEEDVFTISP